MKVVSYKVKETRPDNVFRSWDYDEMNRLEYAYDWRMNSDPLPNQTTTYFRDYAGNIRWIKDTKGAFYYFDYDHVIRSHSQPSAVADRYHERFDSSGTQDFANALLFVPWQEQKVVRESHIREFFGHPFLPIAGRWRWRLPWRKLPDRQTEHFLKMTDQRAELPLPKVARMFTRFVGIERRPCKAF